MSVIQAGNSTTTSLIYTGDTTGNLVFTTGGANTVALTLANTQTATFANTVTGRAFFGGYDAATDVISDNVDGTTAVSAGYTPPETTYLTATWGTPTQTAGTNTQS